MFEKNLNIGYLLDFYGELLPERKRSVMDMYYNEDFSLAEIAEEIDISRQGVRDIVKKCEEELIFYEDKLGLAKKMRQVEEYANSLSSLTEKYELPEELKRHILLLSQEVKK
ncbi:MAG: YlxM family DNA-binding protein [Clostridia bacterium]|nr:YlxM family DNA-binding protein [Clostridia bacterium]